MKDILGAPQHVAASPTILVVDDDRRVVDLLNIALAAHGYRVVTAADGEEAVRVALGKRPDLVVLDVRLPKKSGLEVCEVLRQDPEDPHLPIILVSAASETEARLQGFARGADDYLAKPFSPKELVARIRRLLVRATDAREARRRGHEAEVELARTREDVKRAHQELRKEQRLRELTVGLTRELQGALDADELAGRFLLAVQSRVGVGVAALLRAECPGGVLAPVAIRGDGLERVAGFELRGEGELATLLAGLGRPARRAELERFPELRPELATLVARGFSLLGPIRGPEGLEGLLVADERLDGEDASKVDLEVLGLLCDAAAVGLATARRCQALADGLIETLVAHASETGSDESLKARAEAASLAEHAARALMLPSRLCRLLAPAVALEPWAQSASGRHALALAASCDPTGRLGDLERLVECAAGREGWRDEAPYLEPLSTLLRVARGFAAARTGARGVERALAEAIQIVEPGPDEAMRQALSGAAREVRSLQRSAV